MSLKKFYYENLEYFFFFCIVAINYVFFQDFLGSTQKHYHADLQAVDFSGKAEDCRNEINTWVEQKTEGGKKYFGFYLYMYKYLRMFLFTDYVSTNLCS